MAENNKETNRKKITRQRLAWTFGGGLVVYFFARLLIYPIANIVIPENIAGDLQYFVTLTAVILAFYFGAEYGGQKPET